MFFIKHYSIFTIFILIIIGIFLRFYNINWGSPFYFHPDERNIASSVAQLNFPIQMNPHFFAYGSFPIYLIYFLAFLVNLFHKSSDLFIQAILVSRFYSSLLSLLLIPSIYFIGTKIANKKVGILSAILCTLSVGFIQFAHFGTFEMWLTFLAVWLFYFSLNLINKSNFKNLLIMGILLGLLVSTKISSLPLLAMPVVSMFMNYLVKANLKKSSLLIFSLKGLGIIILKTLFILFISFIILAATSPYIFLDNNSFISSIKYESSVALGTLPVFYTGEFFNSFSILFQFAKIYPFLINPLLTIFFIPSFFYLLFLSIKKRNLTYLLLNTCYLILFFPQAFLFTKWTRYIVPTIPFMYLIISIALIEISKLIKSKTTRYYFNVILILVFIINIIFALSYFVTVNLKPDTRVTASLWAKENIPTNSNILSEVYDLGIVPFNQYSQNISLFNFYDLDQIPDIMLLELSNKLENSNYIILPSQRILGTRLTDKDKFPNGNNFYLNLINGKLNYKKVYETDCDLFCKIAYLDPVFSLEQTANIFDRPTVFIFKKI